MLLSILVNFDDFLLLVTHDAFTIGKPSALFVRLHELIVED